MSETQDRPLAWHLTFNTYGSRLHGDERGSIDREHNAPGSSLVPRNDWLANRERALMKDEPFELDPRARQIVTAAIREVCRYRAWRLHALNVRKRHVHAAVGGDQLPERMMADFKAYATRALIAAGLIQRGRRAWARHGSTRPVTSLAALARVCAYVIDGQGPGRGCSDSVVGLGVGGEGAE